MMQETVRKGGRTDEYTALEERTLIVAVNSLENLINK